MVSRYGRHGPDAWLQWYRAKRARLTCIGQCTTEEGENTVSQHSSNEYAQPTQHYQSSQHPLTSAQPPNSSTVSLPPEIVDRIHREAFIHGGKDAQHDKKNQAFPSLSEQAHNQAWQVVDQFNAPNIDGQRVIEVYEERYKAGYLHYFGEKTEEEYEALKHIRQARRQARLDKDAGSTHFPRPEDMLFQAMLRAFYYLAPQDGAIGDEKQVKEFCSAYAEEHKAYIKAPPPSFQAISDYQSYQQSQTSRDVATHRLPEEPQPPPQPHG